MFSVNLASEQMGLSRLREDRARETMEEVEKDRKTEKTKNTFC